MKKFRVLVDKHWMGEVYVTASDENEAEEIVRQEIEEWGEPLHEFEEFDEVWEYPLTEEIDDDYR